MDLPEPTEVNRVELRPGDIIVIRCQQRLTEQVARGIKERAREVFGTDHKIVVLDSGAHLDVLSEGE